MLSWNTHGKLKLAINYLKDNFANNDIIHISETRHENGSNITNSIPSSLGMKARGGNIVFVKKETYAKLTKVTRKDWCIVLMSSNEIAVFLYPPPPPPLQRRVYLPLVKFLQNWTI